MLDNNLSPAGYIPDLLDCRDHRHRIQYGTRPLPDTFSLEEYAPRPVSQGNTGACAAFASMSFLYTLTARMLGLHNALKINPFELYYQARKRMGTFPADTGTNLRTLMKTLTDTGTVPDSVRYSSVSKSAPEYTGKRFKLAGYERIESADRLQEIKHVLYTEKLPVIIGIAMPVIQINGITRRTGTLVWEDKPLASQKHVWHAMTINGWDKYRLTCWNSWGLEYGLNGYVNVENGYFENSSWTPDLWTATMSHA